MSKEIIIVIIIIMAKVTFFSYKTMTVFQDTLEICSKYIEKLHSRVLEFAQTAQGK